MTEPIRKSYSVVSKAIDLAAGIFETMISTEVVDRQGDIVRATGAQLQNYLKNPVVLWAHDYSEPPVAKALSIEVLPGQGLKSQFQFPAWGVNPKADVIRRLWAAEFLNATSIGFIPLAAKPMDEAQQWGSQEFTSWELLEYSLVPIPANQEALRLAMKTLEQTEEERRRQLLVNAFGNSAHLPLEETKRGRVLSSANENKIKNAVAALQEVLDQLASAAEQESLPGEAPASLDTELEKANPNTDQTSHDEDDALASQLEKILNIFKEKQNG